MRCLLVTSIFPPIHGGSGAVYEALCRHAPRGSMQVLTAWRHFATGEVIEGHAARDREASWPITRIELLRPPSVTARSRLHALWLLLAVELPVRLRLLLAAGRIVRRAGIQVVCIGELISGGWLGPWLRLLYGCRVVHYVHGEEITTVTPWRRYGRDRAMHLAGADAVVAVSRFTRDALVRLMGLPAERITVIENGVDCERYAPGPAEAGLAARLGVPADRRLLLTVGRLIPRKGVDVTLRALPAILAAAPDVHYLVAGVGEYEPTLRALVEELGLQQHVTFAGRVDDADLADCYRLCTLFVMPNRELGDHDTEGFGLVFLEANACGRAVVAGRAGGAVEAVTDGVNGLLVDGRSPEEVAAAVLRLLGDDALRGRLGAGGLARARAASAAAQAARFQALLAQVVQGGSAP